jgi:protein-S-isoprenylcysteine O-methyltransferase Ste14
VPIVHLATPVRVVAQLTFLIWFLMELRQRLRTRAGATNADRHSLSIVWLFGAAGAVAGAILGASVPGAGLAPRGPFLIAGLVVAWAGMLLRGWCFHTLGQYFTFNVMTSGDQPVIDKGPYALLRHPSYAAIEIILAGVGLLYSNWLSLIALVVVPFLGLAWRIRVEEEALRRDLGGRYQAYAATRKRLIPFIW